RMRAPARRKAGHAFSQLALREIEAPNLLWDRLPPTYPGAAEFASRKRTRLLPLQLHADCRRHSACALRAHARLTCARQPGQEACFPLPPSEQTESVFCVVQQGLPRYPQMLNTALLLLMRQSVGHVSFQGER